MDYSFKGRSGCLFRQPTDYHLLLFDARKPHAFFNLRNTFQCPDCTRSFQPRYNLIPLTIEAAATVGGIKDSFARLTNVPVERIRLSGDKVIQNLRDDLDDEAAFVGEDYLSRKLNAGHVTLKDKINYHQTSWIRVYVPMKQFSTIFYRIRLNCSGPEFKVIYSGDEISGLKLAIRERLIGVNWDECEEPGDDEEPYFRIGFGWEETDEFGLETGIVKFQIMREEYATLSAFSVRSNGDGCPTNIIDIRFLRVSKSNDTFLPAVRQAVEEAAREDQETAEKESAEKALLADGWGWLS